MNSASMISADEFSTFSSHNGAHNNLSNFNINYAYLNFSKDRLLFKDSPGNSMKNELQSFKYDSIRDCYVEMTHKTKVLPREMLVAESSKCCLRIRIDTKEAKDDILDICSYKSSNYQCRLEAKFIQENLSNKCANKLIYYIGLCFENNQNIKQYIMSILFLKNRI
jgi:hypothetical protein